MWLAPLLVSRLHARWSRRQLVEHLVDEAVRQHLLRGEPIVAFAVSVDLLDGLPCGVRVDRIQLIAHAQNMTRFDFEIGRLTFEPSADERLVHQVLGVRQRVALALRA